MASMQHTIKHIIFDLDGVLLHTRMHKGLTHLGIRNIIRYIMNHKELPSKAAAFKILEKIPSPSTNSVFYQGCALPPILVDWQKGIYSNQEILKIIQNYLEQVYKKKEIRSSDYRLLQALCNILFIPEKLIATRMARSKTSMLLSKLSEYAAKNDITLYILSNWDKESFPFIKQKFTSIFAHFKPENIMISAHVGLVKPEPTLFELFLKTYALEPAECLFIDDEEANIKSAQACQIQTLHCTPQIYKNLLKSVINFF